MSPISCYHRHAVLPLAFLCVIVAGCAGTEREFGTKQFVASTKESTRTTPFQIVSHRQASDVDSDLAQLGRQVQEELPAAIHDDSTASTEPHRYIPRDANTLPSSFRDLTEAEMLDFALTNSEVLRPLGLRVLENPASVKTVYDPQITASDPFFGPQAALSEFDSVLNARVNAQKNDRVFNNALQEGAVQELVQDLVGINAGLSRRNRTGAVWDIQSIQGYDDNNRLGNRFPNYWETQFAAGVRQPLLRGAGRQFNSIAGPNARPGFNFSNGIVIARLNDRISDADFAIEVRNFVQELYTAYWELDRLYRNYDNLVAARDLAYRTWQSVLAKHDANLVGGEAYKEAQSRAKYLRYRRDVQVALGGQRGEGGLYVAERRLRNLVGLPILDGQLLRPSDRPASMRFVYDYDLLISQGMTERTELQRQGIQLQQQQLRLLAAKNFLLPQMDLIGRYRLRGFGDDLTGSGPRFSSASQDFYSFDHQEWEFGLEMGVVAGRRQAHAAVRNAYLKLNREQAILTEQQRVVRFEISDAYAEVASSFASMETSQAQVDAAQIRLRSSEALFAADKIQIEFLLDAQEELLQSRLQLATDIARYTVSLIEVNAAAGTLLDDIGVHIQRSTTQTHVIYLPEATGADFVPES